MRKYILIFIILAPILMLAQIASDREDGRHLSARGVVQETLNTFSPRLTFHKNMPADSFPIWQAEMSLAMERLMRHPQFESLQAPKLIWAETREGYLLEKWESYPLPNSVVPYYVLIPDGIDKNNPAPASIICIPGFGQSKELVAGEIEGHSCDTDPNAQAQLLARQGYVAVAVDNPSFGELKDNGYSDYLNTSRILLEMGWSYLGLASYQDKVILDWLKQQSHTRPDRIIISGFSLGTEPLMALGLMDHTIYAFIYNDFLCRTRERILVMTKPDEKGNRLFPNSIEHLIPGFLMEFDFPDIVCALAPRPVICTEGGMDRDFDLVQTAFEMAGAPEDFKYYHYQAYSKPEQRQALEALPQGLDRTEYFRLTNVDPPHHYYKWEYIYPWLTQILTKK